MERSGTSGQGTPLVRSEAMIRARPVLPSAPGVTLVPIGADSITSSSFFRSPTQSSLYVVRIQGAQDGSVDVV
jgi:hypothetical protein